MTVWETCFLVSGRSSECASWVQAIGSILALGVAIWAGWYQAMRSREMAVAAIKHAERAQLDARVDQIVQAYAPAMAMAQRAYVLFAEFRTVVLIAQASRADPPPPVMLPADARQLIRAFNDIAVHEMPTYGGVLAILKMKGQLTELNRMSEDFANRHNAHHTFPDRDLDDWHAALESLDETHKELRAEVVRMANSGEP